MIRETVDQRRVRHSYKAQQFPRAGAQMLANDALYHLRMARLEWLPRHRRAEHVQDARRTWRAARRVASGRAPHPALEG